VSEEKESWSFATVVILLEKLKLHAVDRLENSNISGLIGQNNDEP